MSVYTQGQRTSARIAKTQPKSYADDAPQATLTLAHLVNILTQIVCRHVTVVLLAVKCVNKSNVWYDACTANAVSLSARSGTSAAFARKINISPL